MVGAGSGAVNARPAASQRRPKSLLDALARRLADPLLRPALARLEGLGVRPDALALAALACGLGACVAAGLARYATAALLVLLWRLGLAVAAPAFPGLADRAVRGALPLAFALREPADAPAAAALVVALLVDAAVPAANGRPVPGLGLAGALGTTLALLAMLAWPDRFTIIALALAGLTLMSTLARAAMLRTLAREPEEE